MIQPPWPVLYEDNHLLIVLKPAMLPTMGVGAGRTSLLVQAKQYIAKRYAKKGNVYLGIVSRLDAPVAGVLAIARTSKAASRLTEQYRSGRAKKEYLAAVSGTPRPTEGRLVDHLRKDERHRKVHVVEAGLPGAKEARLRYRTLQTVRRISLMSVALETGRKHQIRVQMAHAGHPIVGDRKYGSREPFPHGIGLFSHRLEIEHPVGSKSLEFVAPLPPTWDKLGFETP